MSAERAADIFTKAVVPQKWEHARTLLNIVGPNSTVDKPKVERPASRAPPRSREIPKSNQTQSDEPADPLPKQDDVDVTKLGVKVPKICRGATAVAEHGESIICFNKDMCGVSAGSVHQKQACSATQGCYEEA